MFLERRLVQPAPVFGVRDGRAQVDVETVFLPDGRQEVEEAIHFAVPMCEGNYGIGRVVVQKHRTLGPLVINSGDGGGRAVHRGGSQLFCSDKSLIMEERAEGATRCRDVSRETFANRASSQVGSGAAKSTESEPEVVVGAGERGRLRPEGEG